MQKPTMLVASVFLLGSVVEAQQRPIVTAVLNGASYTTSIARGSIFVAFGTGLGPSSLTLADPPPLHPILSGASIRFTPAFGGQSSDALMFYALDGQVAGLLPSSAVAGNYDVTVTYLGQTSVPIQITVVDRAFGAISRAGNGRGAAVVQNYVSPSDSAAINAFATTSAGVYRFAPAVPGQTMILWGTGLGPISGPDAQAPGVVDLRPGATVTVLVDGREIIPLYAGRAPQFPGEDQINFTLPADIVTGCSVPIQVRVGSDLSNETTLAIAPAGDTVCQHPFLSADALLRLSNGGSVTVGLFSLTRQILNSSVGQVSVDQDTETINGQFTRYGLDSIDQAGGSAISSAINPVGSCKVYRQQIDRVGLLNPDSAPLLDAGSDLVLNGPGINVQPVARIGTQKPYRLVLSQSTGITGLVAPGTYTLSGAGGVDVGPFVSTVTVPSEIIWTNRNTTNVIDRTQPLTVTWTGGSPADVVSIRGIAGTGSTNQGTAFTDASIFVCLADASANSFTVPASILSLMPAANPSADLSSVGQLALSVVTANSTTKFTPSLVAGGSVDYAVFVAANIGGRSVAFQ